MKNLKNFSQYKLLTLDTMKELSKSNDEEVICKFVKELCKLSKLQQYEMYKTPKLESME